jgi:hypothetical protein
VGDDAIGCTKIDRRTINNKKLSITGKKISDIKKY